MKRKLFTLLLVFVTLGAFQANAQSPTTKYWIKVDTTGFYGNAIYSGDKVSPLNQGSIPNNKWLANVGGIKVSKSTTDQLDIYKGKPANVFTVNKVAGVGERFTIAPFDAPAEKLSLSYGGEANTQFEVVRFSSSVRTAQSFIADKVSGYLTPTQGGSTSKNYFDEDLLLVGSTGQNSALTIRKFSEWAKYYAGGALTSPLVGLQVNNKTWQAGRIYTVFNSVNSGFDIYDSAKGVFVLDSLIFGGNPSAPASSGGKYYGTWSYSTNSKSIPYDGDDDETVQSAGNYAYAFLDLAIAANGTLTASDGSTSSLNDLVAAGTLNTNSDPLFTTINPTTDEANIWWGNFFVQINGGKVGLTFRYNTAGVYSWSNGAPTTINGKYYVLNIAGWLGSPGAANVAANLASFANLLNTTFSTNLTATGSRLVLKDPADKWQPLWVEIEPICPDPLSYVTPTWLAANKLLSLPLNNQIWSAGAPVDAWISIGEGGANSAKAIVANEAPANKENVLTHTYAKTITSGVLTLEDLNTINPFGTDVNVDLYYIQNKEGYYLTVVPEELATSTVTTTPGVNGIALQWVKGKYVYNEYDGYDKTVLQLFAVVGYTIKETAPYGEFSYLPLASYRWDYTNAKIVDYTIPASLSPTGADLVVPDIYFNAGLGVLTPAGTCLQSANLEDAARVGYYSSVASSVKQLVVFASSTVGGANITPIEVKLNKENILKPLTGYIYVQDNEVGANKDKFYQTNGTTNLNPASEAASYDLASHWKLTYPTTGDVKVGTFAPELTKIYTTTVVPNQLLSQYYALEYLDGSTYDGAAAITEPLKVRFINLSLLTAPNWVAQYDTLTLVPATHDVPFLDLENPAAKLGVDGYDLAQKLALLEAPFVDRNLTDNVKSDASTPTPSYYGGVIGAYKTYIARIGEGYNDTEYLNVYAVNKRALAEEHIVPYYAFSIIKNDGKEYFLNVKPAGGAGTVDTVLWSTLTDAQRLQLLQWDVKVGSAYPNLDLFPNYKFALPYQVKADSTRVAPIVYNEVARIPVYLQTYVVSTSTETAANPYLIIAGAATKYVNVVKYNDAFFTGQVPANKIYSGNYSKINPEKVTAWIVGGQKQADFEWVPIQGAFTEKGQEQVGVLTNQELGGGGVTYVAASGKAPVNYGALVGLADAQNLTFEFAGDSVIGYNKKQIWYYKIKIAGETPLYLSDTIKTTDASLLYDFNGVDWKYGFFTDTKYADAAKYIAVKADEQFRQTFGLKYVDTDPEVQSFLVVSHANYQASNPVPAYRYLAEANNRLVFVDDAKDGLVFQYGKNIDGSYTDIKAVAKSGIYAVDGGVKVVNGSGVVSIYTIDGRLVKAAAITSSDQTIAAPKGVVIVKNGENVSKVIVK